MHTFFYCHQHAIMQSNNKRIVKNTVFLYIRMLLIMLVTLYTSRVVLSALGLVDFGIFNLIMGLSGMFAFFRSSLSNVTQRYLNFEYGKGDIEGAAKIFNISMTIYFFISIAVLTLGEIIGLWLIYHKLNIPEERMTATLWVFQFMLISLFFTINSIVFNSVIIARENMKIYAYIGLVEAGGKLLIAFIISYSNFDRLIFYSALFVLLTGFIQSFYLWFCKSRYRECTFRFYWNKLLFWEMFRFCGWNLFSTAAYSINFQGISILLNVFFGPAVNAANAVAMQVNGAVNSFTSNFFTAVQPQIIKRYAAKEYDQFISLMFSSSRYAFFLILLLCIPLEFKIKPILDLWLKNPPEYSVEFVRWILIYSTIYILSNPVWTAIQAIGRLKKYCLVESFVFLSALPLSYVLLHWSSNPVIVFQVLAAVRSVYVFAVVAVARQYIRFSFKRYLAEVIRPIAIVSVLSVISCYGLNAIIPEGLAGTFTACFIMPVATAIVIWIAGTKQDERAVITSKLCKFMHKHQ